MNAVNELECGNTPPKLGGVPARTAKREPDRAKPQKKSEQAGGSHGLLGSKGTTPPSLALGRPS